MKVIKTVVIIAISSDIGMELAKNYSRDGYCIIGTYRAASLLHNFSSIPNCYLFYCDISDKNSVEEFIDKFKKINLRWDTFISCVGTLKPIGKFFNCNFDEWTDSIHVNAIEQLRLLHKLYPYRQFDKIVDVVFFAGGGTNNPVPNYSAYTASKIMLIKMCELLDSENDDLNVFIIGPGWVKTKIHRQTLANKEKAGTNYFKTLDFMKNKKGVEMEDIYNCIKWLCQQGKAVSSGRNFSLSNDSWGGEKGETLSKELRANNDMYKLRRFLISQK